MQDKIDAINAMIQDVQDALRAVRSEYQPEQLSPTARMYFDLIDAEIVCLHGNVERLVQFLPVQPQQEKQP